MKLSFASLKSQMEIIEVSSTEDLGNETNLEHSLPPVESMDECDTWGEHEEFPQIGVDFQAEISVLVNKQDYLSQETNSLTGLPIPITFLPRDNGFVSGEEQGYLVVPYSASELWNEVEKESFLLGLYMFGKNIIKLKNFVQCNKKGHVQSYYYGMFYRSQEYLRWSDYCQKTSGRKCVGSEKLFSGVKLQELLSRILPVVSEVCKHAVLEVSKRFKEGKTKFEDFLDILKSLVGINNLVEAVGIGKGKKDLTCILEPLMSYNTACSPELPNGKTFSTLTTSEIVKYLNGNFRMSKRRSNKLFLEAVWPRLETNGWHAETESPKDTLVFLIPGIEAFSRRSLVKGYHYFDCVSDVLNKVASNQELLEIANEDEIEDEDVRNHLVSEEDDVQPPLLIQGTYGTRFTIVDTSLANGDLHKLTDVIYLSADVFTSFNSSTCLESLNQEVPNASADDIELPTGEVQTLEIGNKTQDAYPIPESFPINDDTNSKLKRGLEYKEDGSEGEAPDIKRHRWLTSCNQGETSALQAIVALQVPSCSRANHDNVETILASIEPEQTSRVKNMFDLNLPPDADYDPSLKEEETRGHADDLVYNDASNMYEEATYSEPQQKCIIPQISQRRSTRNRPPTTRALEARANGYLTVNTRRRG